MKLYKNTWFNRFAAKEDITDDELREAAKLLEAGQPNADLGGDVFKMRVARKGGGKSGGYRVIVFFRKGERTFFHYAYPKSFRSNITEKELRIFKGAAKKLLALSEESLNEAVKVGQFIELL